MSPANAAAPTAQSLLRDLPAPVRKALYVAVTLLGLALGVLQAVDVSEIGPLSMTQALQVYAFLSPLAGVVAVANVGRPAGDAAGSAMGSAALGDLVADHGIDMSAFEPVGAIDDVYGGAAANGSEPAWEEPWTTS
ncbi:hypothetical protein GON03_22970 [Nocardioides sp. MAH-18]|uniref:Holin n=1 Tax=Nocardioides agri TaxID=2682843 RepID=A0A6L6XXD8_9ACTN|nr:MULTISPECIES: hypothetical protein [unclassified Nocardioides]MBA2952892.1 hypothetical protein [Nocardioides sp. CGMCC 1.13656]MVQ52054.1 hypothetical protein [Nocardioides sp. MAH-18]